MTDDDLRKLSDVVEKCSSKIVAELQSRTLLLQLFQRRFADTMSNTNEIFFCYLYDVNEPENFAQFHCGLTRALTDFMTSARLLECLTMFI